MKGLFDLDAEYNIIINPELFLIHSFRQLRDDRKDVKLLLLEIGYLYFFYNMESDFQFQTDKKERHKDIVAYQNLPEKWEVDKLLEQCAKDYVYLNQTVQSKLLQSTYITVNKITTQLEEIDLNERDKSGKPVWNLKQAVDSTKAIPDLFESVQKAENAYIKGQSENEKLRGNKLKTLYDNGYNVK